jgi:hypothetical protein
MCFVEQVNETPEAGPAGIMTVNSAGDSGVFGYAGRHAPAPCCLQANVERVNERPGIWRPLSRNKMDPKRVVVMCFVEQVNETPEAGPAEIMTVNSAGDSGVFTILSTDRERDLKYKTIHHPPI